VRLTSIGMNHAELMARRGEYKIASGEPPFIPGLEGGGVVEAVGDRVSARSVGQRVILGLDAPRAALGGEGTYQSHYLVDEQRAIPAPDNLPDEQLGAVWLPYLTAWGCLVWKQALQPGQFVLLPAASSSVAIAASQLVKELGAVPIGTTTSPDKVKKLGAMPEAMYEHIVLTTEPTWWKTVKKITDGHNCDVIFDPVAAGEFLNTEVRLLANGGTLWIYGLLGEPAPNDLTPLIRKRAAIRGWALTELAATGGASLQAGYDHVLARLADGRYKLPVAGTFSLRDVQDAHAQMQQGKHIGKLALIP
jgi:NADPH:quinone reductase-like Zn-dependent oxidoreductase